MDKISWAPKVRQAKIWQLYQNDASGRIDEVLVADVGLALYHRCESIRLVTLRRVECPRCGTVYALRESAPWRLLPGPNPCPTPGCGWQISAEEWHASWQHRDLLGTAVMNIIETYLQDYAKARTAEERMLCIDQAIHAFHIGLKTGKAGRSFANNLIEGSHDQVIALLDRLFAGAGRVDKQQWREEVGRMYDNRRGKEDPGPA